MDGFRVDPTALSRAVDGLREAIGTVPSAPDRTVDLSAEAVGHAGLADGLAAFHGRWADGVAVLSQDAREMAARLGRSIDDYVRADQLPSGDTDPPAAG